MAPISRVRSFYTISSEKAFLLKYPDTEEQKKRFRDNPELYLKYSKMIESELNQRFKFILNGTPEAEAAKEVWLPSSLESPLTCARSLPSMK